MLSILPLDLIKAIHKKSPRYLPIILPISVISGIFDGISIMMILPILELINSGDMSDNFGFLSEGLTYFGLEVTPVNLLIILSFSVVTKAAISFSQNLYCNYVALNYEAQEKAEIWKNILWCRWERAQKLSTGKISNTVLVEIPRARDAFIHVGEIATALVFIVAYLIIGMLISFEGPLIAIFITLLLSVFYFYIVKRSRALGEKLTELNFNAQHNLHEGIIGLKYIKAIFMNEVSELKYAKVVEKVKSNSIKFSMYNVLTSVIKEPFTLIVIGAVATYYFSTNQPFPVLIAISLILFRLYGKISGILHTLPALNNLMPAWEVVEKFREETSQFPEMFGDKNFNSLHECIEFNGVYFEYQDGSKVLSDCNLTIKKGTTTALIGRSGAGKTTIIDLVIGLLVPSSGSILIDGLRTTEIDMREFRSRLGLVPQEPVLFNDTVENNIRLQCPGASKNEIERAARAAYAHDFILALPDGYQTAIDERGGRLSGGQRQRIALARSLLAQPEILILDEATSALDSKSGDKIQQALADLQGEVTIIIIAHRERTIENADVVYNINNGKATNSVKPKNNSTREN